MLGTHTCCNAHRLNQTPAQRQSWLHRYTWSFTQLISSKSSVFYIDILRMTLQFSLADALHCQSSHYYCLKISFSKHCTFHERSQTACRGHECCFPTCRIICHFAASICITCWWTGDCVTLCGPHGYSLSSYGAHDIIYGGLAAADLIWLCLWLLNVIRAINMDDPCLR